MCFAHTLSILLLNQTNPRTNKPGTAHTHCKHLSDGIQFDCEEGVFNQILHNFTVELLSNRFQIYVLRDAWQAVPTVILIINMYVYIYIHYIREMSDEARRLSSALLMVRLVSSWVVTINYNLYGTWTAAWTFPIYGNYIYCFRWIGVRNLYIIYTNWCYNVQIEMLNIYQNRSTSVSFVYVQYRVSRMCLYTQFLYAFNVETSFHYIQWASKLSAPLYLKHTRYLHPLHR